MVYCTDPWGTVIELYTASIHSSTNHSSGAQAQLGRDALEPVSNSRSRRSGRSPQDAGARDVHCPDPGRQHLGQRWASLPVFKTETLPPVRLSRDRANLLDAYERGKYPLRMIFDAQRSPNAVTVASLISERMGMGVHCNCARHVVMDPATPRLAPETPVPSLAGRFKCTRCGSKQTEARPEWPGR